MFYNYVTFIQRVHKIPQIVSFVVKILCHCLIVLVVMLDLILL